MAKRNSYRISHFLPCKESLQNVMTGILSLNIVPYVTSKIVIPRHSTQRKDEQDKVSSKKQMSLFILLFILQEKLIQLSTSARVFILGHSKSEICSCSGIKGSCRYSNHNVDANDYYHALKNTHTNVPECSVEPYLFLGYVLPHRPWRYYLRVLWIPNNEMLNVWTHLLPAMYFMWLLYQFIETMDLLRIWPLLFVTTAAIALTLCSSIAHMFHSRSNYHHCCLFILDYFGITMFAFSSTAAHFFVNAEESYYIMIGWYNLLILFLIAAVGFYFSCFSQTGRKNSNTHHRHFKLWTNIIGCLYGMLPLMHRLATSTSDDPAHFYFSCQFLCLLTSPILYVSDFPQKYWPGKFDIIGHSHQIFHLIVAFGCYCDIKAISIDVSNGRWTALSEQIDYPPFEVAGLVIATLVAYCLLVGLYFSRRLKQCFQNELNAMFGCCGEANGPSNGGHQHCKED